MATPASDTVKARTLSLLLAGTALLRATPASAEASRPRLEVKVERGGERGASEYYVPVHVTIINADTNQPASEPYDLFAAATSRSGEVTQAFSLVELPAAGAYSGFVIVPHGGPWTITASVNRRQDERTPGPPVTYAQGTVELDVEAASLSSAPGGVPQQQRGARPLEVAVLAAHTFLALGWGLAVALLALLTLPFGRRVLSEGGANALDRHLPLLVRSIWWITGGVALTGVYNLANSVPYRVPLSLAGAHRVFRLPYAEPYYLTLGAKLVAYAAMVAATIPLMVRARRRASLWAGRPDRATESPAQETAFDPWEDRHPALVTTAARLGLPHSRGAKAEHRAPGSPKPLEIEHLAGSPLPFVVLFAGGTVIIIAVTLLKYLHLISEAVRGAG